jgi:hypothetical protein
VPLWETTIYIYPNEETYKNLFESSKINGFAGGLFARKFFTITDKFFFSLEGKGLIGNLSRDENAAMFNEGGTRLNISLLSALYLTMQASIFYL